jgi:hypothetical protein
VLLPIKRRRSHYDIKVALAYWLGATAGAITSAVALWVIGGFFSVLNRPLRLTLLSLGAITIWALKRGAFGPHWRLPEARRQIPAEIFGGDLIRGAIRFGFEMGTGARTFSPSPAPYLLALVILVAGLSLGQALLLGIGFGLGRAAPLLAGVARKDGQSFNVAHMAGEQFGPAISTVMVFAGALSLV